MRPRSLAGALLFALAAFLSAPPLRAQVDPSARYRTIVTPHFRVHFTRATESVARRAAVDAERAWAQLAAELAPPRGPVDLVVSDDVDFSNGYTTPFPTNRIVIYAHPPVDDAELRFYSDWTVVVVTHELTHAFHLDRSRGVWRLGQWVFGRNPFLFPNVYLPAWVTEGLAVYYESRLTGTGRLAGTAHATVARAAALDRRLPALGQVTLAAPGYPGGERVYVYGSLLLDYLARTRGEGDVRRFVDRTSASFPYLLLHHDAKRAFGVSLSRAWRQWQDSVRRATGPAPEPLPGWRQLTGEGYYLAAPRWEGDRLVYSAYTGRDVTGAYAVAPGAAPRRLGRRNSLGPSVPMPDGSLLFAQLELVDPYHVRSDLWLQRGARQERLTRGARLSMPDARADGRIVAVQSLPGTTRLVLIARDGSVVRPITTAAADTQWTEPRWSPAGDAIAAVRLVRGGYSDVVVLDTLGRVARRLAHDFAVNAAPAWTPDGASVVYASDRSGSAELYVVSADDSTGATTRRLSDGETRLVDPAVSPDGSRLAAAYLRADGFHLGVGALDTARAVAARDSSAEREPLPPAGASDAPARAYSPWTSLLPRYWLPVLYQSGGRTSYGAMTSGSDVIGRHVYSAQAAYRPGSGEGDGSLYYTYAGFGQPLLDVALGQDWSTAGFFRGTDPATGAPTTVGYLRERTRSATVAATFRRPRVRASGSLSLGATVERLDYGADPDSLFARVSARFAPRSFRALFTSAAWSNVRYPAFAISPEDGVSLSALARLRWPAARADSASRELVGAASGYRALDLPGFAHHVLAVRAAAGWEDDRAEDLFGAGGTSGSSLDIPFGASLGGTRRTFGVRGYPADALLGTRALAGSAEYRLPLVRPAAGSFLLPAYLDRASLSLFADAGTAWCSASLVAAGACASGGDQRHWLASFGAEVGLNAALWYDVPYLVRLGVAVPTTYRELATANVRGYATFGLSF